MNTAQKFQQAAVILLESIEDNKEWLKNLYALITAYTPPGVIALTLNDYPALIANELQGERVANMTAGVFMGYEDSSASIVCFTTKGVHISTPPLDTKKDIMELVNSLSEVSSVAKDVLKRLST